MTVRAAWLLPGGTGPGQTREDTRLTPVGTWAPASELETRPGVVPGGAPFAATAAGAMSLQIGVGRAIAQGTAAQGAYPIAVTSPETLTFRPGAAQFARIDTVVLRIYDGLYDQSGQTVAAVEIVEGEATATPTAPTLPPACLPLWDVTVPAGASAGVGGIDWASALTDRRQYTVAAGGIIPAAPATAYDGAYDGQYRDTGTGLERWSQQAGQWQAYPPPDAGWRAYTPTLSNTTLGNGVLRARYMRHANRVIVAYTLSWGSTTSGNLPEISTPIAPASLGGMRWTGTITINRGSGRFRVGSCWLYDSSTRITSAALYMDGSAPALDTNVSTAGISMSPGGWITGSIEYEAAS